MTEIITNNNVSSLAKVLYIFIKENTENDEFTMTNKDLAEIFNRTTINMSRIVSELRDAGYITVEFTHIPGTKGIDKRIIKIIK